MEEKEEEEEEFNTSGTWSSKHNLLSRGSGITRPFLCRVGASGDDLARDEMGKCSQ
jgi:hypothetical protein